MYVDKTSRYKKGVNLYYEVFTVPIDLSHGISKRCNGKAYSECNIKVTGISTKNIRLGAYSVEISCGFENDLIWTRESDTMKKSGIKA